MTGRGVRCVALPSLAVNQPGNGSVVERGCEKPLSSKSPATRECSAPIRIGLVGSGRCRSRGDRCGASAVAATIQITMK